MNKLKHQMNCFISSLQFITVIPAGRNSLYEPVGMVPYFPVVGLLIGILLCIVDRCAGYFWPVHAVAVLDVVFLVCITGAFHLDGLADAADGLFSHRPKERMLEIMKDSSTGVMGAVAVICGLGVKWAGISALPESGTERILLLIIIPAFSRGSMIFGIRFLEYGRKTGTGHDLFNIPQGIGSFIWLLLPIVLSLFLGFKGLWLMVCFAGSVTAILSYYRKKLGCITGDMLGAITEVTESVLFLLVAASFQ